MAKVTVFAVLASLCVSVRSQYGEVEGPNLSHLYRHNLAASGQLAAHFGALRQQGAHHRPHEGPSHSHGTQQSGGYHSTHNAYGGAQGGQGGHQASHEELEPAHYEFSYQVSDPEHYVDFGHEEKREGDLTQGKYYVLLPDGRKQVVDYTADKAGYKPTISYEGTASHGSNHAAYGAPSHNPASHGSPQNGRYRPSQNAYAANGRY